MINVESRSDDAATLRDSGFGGASGFGRCSAPQVSHLHPKSMKP